MLADRRYCYPLTITDFASRYFFACEALSTTKEAYAFPVFKAVFKEFGLPKAIRTDNGVPFASPNALFGLSKVSVWWLRLGIEIERIKPGNPQQNGRHERMHLTYPSGMTLAHDIGLARLPLGVERIEFLLEPLVGRFSGVDRAADGQPGSRGISPGHGLFSRLK